MIACTTECIYQKDGICGLEHATSPGEPSCDGCRYGVRRQKTRSHPHKRDRGGP